MAFLEDFPNNSTAELVIRLASICNSELATWGIPVPTSVAKVEQNTIGNRGTQLTWGLSILACVYFVWMGANLFYSTGVFKNMFSSMGVDLPFLTRLVIGTYHFSYPVIFGGAAILVIAKQFYVREKWANISTTFGAVLVLDFVSNLIVRALYGPLLDIMEKLSK